MQVLDCRSFGLPLPSFQSLHTAHLLPSARPAPGTPSQTSAEGKTRQHQLTDTRVEGARQEVVCPELKQLPEPDPSQEHPRQRRPGKLPWGVQAPYTSL